MSMETAVTIPKLHTIDLLCHNYVSTDATFGGSAATTYSSLSLTICCYCCLGCYCYCYCCAVANAAAVGAGCAADDYLMIAVAS